MFATEAAKWEAIVERVRELHQHGKARADRDALGGRLREAERALTRGWASSISC